jgi:hypothetical protein
LHENKNNLNVVSATASFHEEQDKISSFQPSSLLSSNSILQQQQPTPTAENIIATLVDIKSEIISPSTQAHHLTTSTTPQQRRIIHQNSSSAVVARPTGLTSSTTGTTPRSSSKPQACKVCGKILSSASSYYVHMKLHSGSKPFQCNLSRNQFHNFIFSKYLSDILSRHCL